MISLFVIEKPLLLGTRIYQHFKDDCGYTIFEEDNPYLFFNSQEHESIVELDGINYNTKNTGNLLAIYWQFTGNFTSEMEIRVSLVHCFSKTSFILKLRQKEEE